ncbi:hypothetical protein CNE_2c18970 [Cupriavidus necator N-1]|uniref:Uncharacterized protein n=1 Tax=Cupriavidus necator (strain ATCC 43291 / DSM 13513 / CCUG 52238 / LMG 8453 / N-1) TaxID=1042878 RepID=F8GRI8_CUPNN|nr:hypothetical protein CNE_2c18970 [Cupriavidus necator N-1]KAI3608272.1 hypothetical protein D8I24_1268 [Cupriavidus necator H850]
MIAVELPSDRGWNGAARQRCATKRGKLPGALIGPASARW